MKLHTIAAALVCAPLLAPASALAGAYADVEIVNRTTGQSLPLHRHGGQAYVAGNPGDRYAVRIRNRTGGRLLAVVSVDGINIVTGETASQDQTGYVLGPRAAYDLSGWRKNQHEIAAFYFTSPPDSYAGRTDRVQNVGVIGVAIFREWTPPPPRHPAPAPHPRPFEQSSDARASAAESPSSAEQSGNARREADEASGAADRMQGALGPRPRLLDKLGTGHGEREHSTVSYTHFRRASAHPSELITIRYDRLENLIARGIVPASPPVATPQPFPGFRYVPDPRG